MNAYPAERFGHPHDPPPPLFHVRPDDDQDDYYRLDGYAVVLALVVVAFAVLTAAILTGVWS